MFLIVGCISHTQKNVEDDIRKQYENVIPFKTMNNLPIIEAEINGISAKFLVDSGASISALDLTASYVYGYSIDFDKPTGTATGIGGKQPLYYMKNVKFSSTVKDTVDISFRGMDLVKFRIDYGILGILGSDYLKSHGFIIDYKNNVIKKK
jgi:hypothetical protein